MFPNPSKGRFTLDGFSNYGLITVINSIGEAVYINYITQPQINIDLSNHPKGIYFVRFDSNNDIGFRKIILE